MSSHLEATLDGQCDVCEGVVITPDSVEGILQVLREVVPFQAVLLIVHLKYKRDLNTGLIGINAFSSRIKRLECHHR